MSSLLGGVTLVAIGLYGVAVVLGALLPIRWVGPAALVVYALFPVEYFDTSDLVRAVPPALVVLLVGLQRRLSDDRDFAPGGARVTVLLGLFCAAAVLSATVLFPSREAVSWVVTASIALVGIPILWSRNPDASGDLLLRSWLALGGALGVYAILEKYALGSNPLGPYLYPAGSIQAGSFEGQVVSIYRVTTTLGHPLVNSMFFAVASTIGVALYFDSRRGRAWIIPATVISMIALLATVARGGILALSFGIVLAVMVALYKRPGRTFAASLFAMPVLIFAFVQASGDLLQRIGSADAQASSQTRERLLHAASEGIKESPWVGYGVQGLGEVARITGAALGGGNFENSAAELALSFGVPIALVLLAALVCAAVAAIRNDVIAGAAALVSISVVATSFNMLFGHPHTLILIGLLVAVCTRANFNPQIAAHRSDAVSAVNS